MQWVCRLLLRVPLVEAVVCLERVVSQVVVLGRVVLVLVLVLVHQCNGHPTGKPPGRHHGQEEWWSN
jgi:hypothetical protein